MSLINDIDVNTIEKVNINKEKIFNYKIQDINNSLPQAPPVTLTIGSPIINLPGCIKYNITNKKSNELISFVTDCYKFRYHGLNDFCRRYRI